MQEGADDGLDLGGPGDFGECLIHQGDPAVSSGLSDREGGVADFEAGVASFLDVGVGAAEAEDEETGQALFGGGECLGGVHRAEDVVAGDLTIEESDQAPQFGFADCGDDGESGVGVGVAHGVDVGGMIESFGILW